MTLVLERSYVKNTFVHMVRFLGSEPEVSVSHSEGLAIDKDGWVLYSLLRQFIFLLLFLSFSLSVCSFRTCQVKVYNIKLSSQYVAWSCVTHLEDKGRCFQKYATDDVLKLVFVTATNKLVLRQQMVLRPLLQSLRGLNDQSRLLKIEELETAIEKNREQKQVLMNLMASGYLEPALFNKESNELAAEADTLRQEKDRLMRSVNGDMVKIEELQRLLGFTSKGNMMTEFDDEIFLSFMERITVLSRKEVVFELKCGLSLKERLVEP